MLFKEARRRQQLSVDHHGGGEVTVARTAKARHLHTEQLAATYAPESARQVNDFFLSFLSFLYYVHEFISLIICVILNSNMNIFFTSKPKNIYFSCQINWLNIFLVRLFSYRQINLTWKVNLFKPFTWKILLNLLRNCKEA